MSNKNVTKIERLSSGMVKLYDRSNVIGAFSALNSISIEYENNNARSIQFTDNGNTISFQLFNLQEVIGSTTTATYSPIITVSTGPEYDTRVFEVFDFLSSEVFQGFSPGPTYVGGVVAAYPNFASFPVTGTQSVIYIDEADNSAYYWDGTSYQLLVSTGVEQYASFALFPVTGSANVIYIDMSVPEPYVWDGTAYESIGSAAVWGGITGTLSAQTDLQAALNAKFDVPTGTTLEYLDGAGTPTTFPAISGGTVTSVDLTAGTGISVSGGPITSSGSITVTNSAPDQTVVLNSGTGISTSGTYPNFTITNSAPDQTVALTAGTGIGVTGTYPNFTITNSSPSTGGTVTSVGTTGLISGGPITGSGTITTSMATNRLVGRSTAGTGIMEEVTIGSGLTLTGAGVLNNTATPTPTGYYGAWQDNATQTAAASNTGYAMIFGTVDLENQVRVVTNGTNLTRITFDNTGIYNLQFSSQFQNTDSQEHDVTIWLRLNGVDVPASSGFVSIPAKHGSVNGHTVTSWNYLLSVVAGQYYELMWSTTSHTNVTMRYYAAGSPPPSAASVILTVTQQSGIMAGTGITAINSLTGAVQTLATNGSGTDFNIASTGTTHTFNLPTASAANRGALSSADWSAFNGKFTLPALTSGSVLFSNGTTIAQDNAELFWDDTNNRLGIGTNNPSAYYAKKLVVAAPDEDGITIFANSVSSSSYLAFADGTTGNQAFRGYISYKHLSDQLAFGSAGTLRMTIASTGNVLINTTTDAGYKLDVNGTARFVSDIRSTTGVYIGTTATFTGVFPTGTAGRETILVRGGLFPTDVGVDVIISNAQGEVANTTSNRTLLSLSRGFNPTSGSGIYNVIQINPTINQTGGASGVSRGLYINPTLTAAANFRAIETTAGNVLFGASGTGFFWDNTNSRVGIGTASPSQALTIASGSIAMTESFPIRWGSSNLLYGSATGLDIASSAFAVRFRFTVGGTFLIGTTTDIASSKLTVDSTTQGFLPPRMTTTQKNAIATPATGLVVFDVTLGKLCVFSTTWQTVTSI